MSYATQDIITALKQARETSGLSQRALAKLTGVPQSHVSKIERGGTDIRLSSLIELGRALDLELKLVPRKAVSAIETIVRSTVPALATPQLADTAKAIRQFNRTLETVKDVRALYPNLAALTQIQDSLQSLKNLQSAGRDLGTFLASIRKSYEPLQAQLEQIRKIADPVKTVSPEVVRSLTQVADNFRQIRNQIAHGLPAAALPRPAYHLDQDEGHPNG